MTETEQIISILAKHSFEPMDAIMDTKNKMFMEWIVGTDRFVSNLRKVIYELSFADIYYHDKKIPCGHIAMGEYLYKIERSATLGEPELFLEILTKIQSTTCGTRFYLDGILYKDNVPFTSADRLRNNLLQQRCDCTKIFQCLTIIDPSGNITQFLASSAVERRMKQHLNQ
jgi:hypothetical protein